MHDNYDPRTTRQSDDSEEMMLAEALYLYERSLEGDDQIDDEE